MASLYEEFTIGKPVTILEAHQNKTNVEYSFNSHELQKILMKESVVHKKVVIVSISGVLRTGKSFMLNYFIRFLKADEESIQNGSWLGDEEEKLEGFSWRGGDERETTGILMWSKPFIKKLPNGEEVAVVLMDTQGAFDPESGTNDCATIFALSTILSSVQIWNVMNMLDESVMQYLRVFSEYGKLISDKNDESEKFQHLLFLVRDWKHPKNHPYGKQGGTNYINKMVFDTSAKNSEVVENRNNLKKCFQHITGFLLPHPCFEANEDENFKGEVKYLRDNFKKFLVEFINMLFTEQNLKPKMIRGREMTCHELYHQFSNQYENFQTSKMPTVKAIQLGIDNAELFFHVSNCLEEYRRSMRKTCDNFQVSEDDCRQNHAKCFENAKNMFENTIENWSDHGLEQYRTKIINECESYFAEYLNQCKLWTEKRDTTVKLLLTSAVSSATQKYKSLMEGLLTGEMDHNDLMKSHTDSKQKSQTYFTENIADAKGNNEEISTFTKQLNEDCDREFVAFQNKWKDQRKSFGKHQLEEAIIECVETYRQEMTALQEKQELISFQNLNVYHEGLKNKCNQTYNQMATWQDKLDIDQCKTKLNNKLERMWKDFGAHLEGYHQRKCSEVQAQCVEEYKQSMSNDFQQTLSKSALSDFHRQHLSTVVAKCTSDTSYFLTNDKLESLKQSISDSCENTYRQHEDARKDWESEETKKRSEETIMKIQKQSEEEKKKNEKDRDERAAKATKDNQELMEQVYQQKLEAEQTRAKHELEIQKEKHKAEMNQKNNELKIQKEKEERLATLEAQRQSDLKAQKESSAKAETERKEATDKIENEHKNMINQMKKEHNDTIESMKKEHNERKVRIENIEKQLAQQNIDKAAQIKLQNDLDDLKKSKNNLDEYIRKQNERSWWQRLLNT